MEKIKQHLQMLRGMNLKPNFSELARIYGIDRRTVKKYWEGYQGKPKTRNKPSKLDKYFEKIAMLMSIKGITIRAAYERLRDEEGDVIGTYSNFRKYVKRKGLRAEKNSKGHPRFETLPGIQAQVDWKENMRLHSKSGEEFVVNVFNYKLGYSRYCYFEYRQSKTQQDIFECLINAFKATGGVPQEILFDNMKSVVDITENGRKINNKMKAFAKDFGFKIKLCKPKHSYTKGKVESANKFLNWLLAYNYAFESEEELKDIIRRINKKVNTRINQATNVPPLLLFQKEKEYLFPLPKRHIIESYVDYSVKVKVQKDSLIYYKGNKYSVPPEYIGKIVNLKINENYIYVYYITELIAVHEITGKKINYLNNHYMALMRKHIKSGEELKEVCENNLKNLDKFLQEGNV
ncbi:IS21 family transposase [Thermosipho ferrireducens]|uniref:IS21 family transposase n=1 Tax=Thermosipho ferrireducens TaxID=2571116 RepID=A0ABX7S9R7_9BACT|nr:IS21 family transposase [Thermosipho ferrireducens]QTA37559.1 IS21 family transposase [Thermosipho ferrireducens]QTA37763.1 IS21 family transposase [Thermosipho ferrireducens]QTA38462.1 IS21 family transposase [Thermosipho ferrireducens]QTA38661.1 IS21 family transposase [Thermosipho ferrireducens]